MGEFERIDLFLKAFRDAGGRTEGATVPLGPGDDAAIVDAGGPLVVTTDALFEGVHFRRDWATPRQLGHKALATNLSDLAGMGARAVAFTCAFGLPGDVDDGWLAEVARGMAALAGPSGALLAGGNFSRAREVSITVTAMGRCEANVLRRDAARIGERVLVAGALGEAGAELRALVEGRIAPALDGALHTPEPRLAEGIAAGRVVRCGIDVSDGLAQDLGHVARASKVRIRLDFPLLPRSARFLALTRGMDDAAAGALLVAGGEDYALVVTAREDEARQLAPLGFVAIGSVVSGEGVELAGAPAGMRVAGHDHFA